MSELAITLVTIIVVSVIGWVISIWISSRISSRAAIKQEGKYEERINNVVKRIDSLPCEHNPSHETDLGKLAGNVEGLDKTIKSLQEQLVIQNISRAEGVSNLHKRIDALLGVPSDTKPTS